MLEHSFPREHLQLTNTVQVSLDHGGHKPTFIFTLPARPLLATICTLSNMVLYESTYVCMCVFSGDTVQQSKNLHTSQTGNYKLSVSLYYESESVFVTP